MVWAWLPAPALRLESVAHTFTAELDEAISVAGGEPARGLAGFRLTHSQARQAHAVATAARLTDGRRMTLSAQVGPVALMCGDLDATAAWVRRTLGRLATDDETHARLRDTLWSFLSNGSSYTAAAHELILHKNTVQYRVRKAEDVLGRPVQERRLELELALQVCRVLELPCCSRRTTPPADPCAARTAIVPAYQFRCRSSAPRTVVLRAGCF